MGFFLNFHLRIPGVISKLKFLKKILREISGEVFEKMRLNSCGNFRRDWERNVQRSSNFEKFFDRNFKQEFLDKSLDEILKSLGWIARKFLTVLKKLSKHAKRILWKVLVAIPRIILDGNFEEVLSDFLTKLNQKNLENFWCWFTWTVRKKNKK